MCPRTYQSNVNIRSSPLLAYNGRNRLDPAIKSMQIKLQRNISSAFISLPIALDNITRPTPITISSIMIK